MKEFDQKVPLDSKKNEESVTAVFQSVWEIFTLNLAVLSDLSTKVTTLHSGKVTISYNPGNFIKAYKFQYL